MRMNYTTRLARAIGSATLAFALAVALAPAASQAATRAVKSTAAHKAHKPGRSKPGAGVKAHAKSKAHAKASAKAGKGARIAKRQGPIVVRLPSPPAAALAELKEAKLQTGCLDLASAATEMPLMPFGITPSQLQMLITARQERPSEACAPFAAVILPGADAVTATSAFVPSDDSRALVISRDPQNTTQDTQWLQIDANSPNMRELWLSPTLLTSTTADPINNLPLHLQHELGLLVRQMRKDAGATENTVVRAWVDGQGAEATLSALELIDNNTGQALDSVVWLARSDEPGAFISVRGTELERMLWQAPVDYRRISRGIGASSMLVHKKVRVTVKSKKGRVRKKLVVQAFRYESHHVGIDFAADTGTPVVAVADGEVVFSGRRGGYGNLIIVQHGSDLTTYYAHLSAFTPNLQEGSRVRRGQEIGQVGSTGFSTGPHLHFEIRKGAKYMDPTHADQRLTVWTLMPQEHLAVLTPLLRLQMTRAEALQRVAAARAAQSGMGQ
jgi:murein DD-endopeptidase MepM/ murein hydrolase activator NlpD